MAHRRFKWGGWLLSVLLPLCALAAEPLTIRAPYVAAAGGVYLLNTQLQFTVPEDLAPAIRDGATLNLTLDVKVSRNRNWWSDAVLAELEQRYELVYHRVSERYLVRNLNSGAQASFVDLPSALDSLRNIQNLPVLDQELVMPDTRNEMSVRAALQLQSIPSVLSVLLFWKSDFGLQSDWYTWPLTP